MGSSTEGFLHGLISTALTCTITGVHAEGALESVCRWFACSSPGRRRYGPCVVGCSPLGSWASSTVSEGAQRRRMNRTTEKSTWVMQRPSEAIKIALKTCSDPPGMSHSGLWTDGCEAASSGYKQGRKKGGTAQEAQGRRQEERTSQIQRESRATRRQRVRTMSKPKAMALPGLVLTAAGSSSSIFICARDSRTVGERGPLLLRASDWDRSLSMARGVRPGNGPEPLPARLPHSPTLTRCMCMAVGIAPLVRFLRSVAGEWRPIWVAAGTERRGGVEGQQHAPTP